jgi:hypothetical protein
MFLTSGIDTFPYLIANGTVTGEYQYVRITANHCEGFLTSFVAYIDREFQGQTAQSQM